MWPEKMGFGYSRKKFKKRSEKKWNKKIGKEKKKALILSKLNINKIHKVNLKFNLKKKV